MILLSMILQETSRTPNEFNPPAPLLVATNFSTLFLK